MISHKIFTFIAALWTVSPGFALSVSGPANDSFANAATLVPGASTVDNTFATAQPGEPAHFTFGGVLHATHSVWWKFTPTFSGYIQLDTVGSAYDTVLSVYTGTVVTKLTRVAQNNDPDVIPPVHTSILRIAVSKGVTYHIAVDGLNSGDAGSTTLNLTYIRINTPRTYQVALMQSDNKDDDGILTFSTTASSVVTGKVNTGAKSYPFTGAVSVDGHLLVSVNRPGMEPVLVDLTVGSESAGAVSGPATGTVQVGDTSISVTAYPAAVYTTANPCPRIGRYNYAVDATGAVGYGVAAVTVGNTGVCTGSGTLGDGSTFVFTAPILDDSGSTDGDIGTGGSCCYQVPLYSLQGQITGRASFDATASPAAVTGLLAWFRPAPKAGMAFLPQGIYGSEVVTFGSRYLPPLSTHRVDSVFDASSGACTLEIGDVDFAPFTKSLVLSTSNTFPAPISPNFVTLKVSTNSGVVTGTVKRINSATSYKISTVMGIVVDAPGHTHQFYGFAAGVTGNSTLIIHP